MFDFRHKFADCNEGYTYGWTYAGVSWGLNTINDAVGQDAAHTLPAPNNFRANFAYYGPHSGNPSGTVQDDIGAPDFQDGHILGGIGFTGEMVLHADKSPQDTINDPAQPQTTTFMGSDGLIETITPTSPFSASVMTQQYQSMTAGHTAQTHAEQIGKDANGWPTSFANTWGGNTGGYSNQQGFGPYTLAPGDSIRIVIAEAVAGISREKNIEIARNWFTWYQNGKSGGGPFALPSGSTTTDGNIYKNSWVFSGKDSLFQTFKRAIANYTSGYNIPQPPPPPDNFSVKSGGNKRSLSWSSNADAWPHFNGYRIYRAANRTDTTFDLIFSCDAGNVRHSYDDTTARPGYTYFYYIETKDDGSTNDIQPGVPLVSGKFYTMTNKGAHLYLINADDFQSHQSGDWNDVNTWERFEGSSWVHPAPNIPTNTSRAVTILDGHTITVSSTDSADQLIILPGGALTVDTNAIYRMKNGAGRDITVNGTLTNFGSIEADDSAGIVFADSSKYVHKQNGGSIPLAGWASGSICEITDITDTPPSNANQYFDCFIWNCPNQSANINLNFRGKSINSLTVKNTNWNHTSPDNPSFRLSLFSASGSFSLGSLSIEGPHAALVQQEGNFSNTITVSNNITISGGGLLLLSTDSNGVIQNNWWGNFTIPDSGFIGSISQRLSTIYFDILPKHFYSVPPTGVHYIGGINFSVPNTITLNLGSSVLRGSGSFTLQGGATVETMAPGGLDSALLVTGTKNLNIGANYIFDGSAAQVTGNLLPDTVANLTIDDSLGVALSDSIVVNGRLLLNKGVLSTGNNSVIVNGTLEKYNGTLSMGTNPIIYGPNSSLTYSGILPFITTETEFPSVNGQTNLRVATSGDVALHSSRTLSGVLDLAYNLLLGANSLSAGSVSTIRNAYVNTGGGGFLRTVNGGSFPVGTSVGYAPILITFTPSVNGKNADTASVCVVDDTTRAAGGGRVKVKWKIRENTVVGRSYRIRFNWMSSLEDAAFQTNRTSSAKIFSLSDTTEAGTGSYTKQVTSEPYFLQRSTIITLDSFAIGMFKIPTGVTEINNDLPRQFNLSQNYPNPFNPATVFHYQLPTTCQVRFDVFDVLGRAVATLVNEKKSAGNYSMEFNARRLTSGIYFYRLQAGAFTETKKFLLLK